MKKLLSLPHCFTIPLVLASLGLLLGACDGSTTDPEQIGPPAEKYTLDTVCNLTAPLICDTRETCCTTAGAYEQMGCITNETAQCEKNVADVKAGLMTFDASAVDACIEATKPYAEKCYLYIEDLFTAPTGLESCSRVFAGQLAEGETCERTEQCKSSLSNKEFVQCDTDTKKCTTTRFLPLDASCKLGQNLTEFCDQGLYCDFDFLAMKGTCKPQTPSGSACTPGLTSFECGLGNLCDSMTNVCVEARNEGEACQSPLDCKSLNCSGGTCAKPAPIFDKKECTGMP